MEDPQAQLLAAAVLSRAAFAPVTKSGSAAVSDAMLDSIWEFLKTEPPSLNHLQLVDGKRDWLGVMNEMIFGSLREGLATTRYHLDRVELLEGQITAIAKAHENALFGQGMTLGLHSRPLVAEYQAFELALRRSLEYLAGGIAAYFKTEGNRIRTLHKTVAGRAPKTASFAIIARLKASNIEELIGARSGPKSVRDRLAHHESVSPGVVNIGRGFDGALWIRLHGEAEDLNALGGEQTQTLSRVLQARVKRVEAFAFCLFEDLGLVQTSDPAIPPDN
jgi:hypothetical protein